VADSIQQQIDALRATIANLMRENDRLNTEMSEDADLDAIEQKVRENLDLISSLASRIIALEKQRLN
jgi:cell division protein FtsB